MIDTEVQPWSAVQNWPSTIDAVGVSSPLGLRIQEARSIGAQARQKRAEALQLAKQVADFDAQIAAATPATDWRDLARATVMLPVYRRTIDELQAEAVTLEEDTRSRMALIDATWSEYHALFLRWQKTPSADLASRLAAYCWPTR